VAYTEAHITKNLKRRHHFSYHSTPRPAIGPPTIKQINNTSRHNPGDSKTTKKSTPSGGSHITMEKVIHQLPIPLAHVTSVPHDDVPPSEIIQGEDLA
jgi:hypothetical protein